MKNEFVFRLGSIVLLAVLFVSAKAVADKEEGPQTNAAGIFANIALADEANLINNGAFNASRLTTVGDQTENIAKIPSRSK